MDDGTGWAEAGMATTARPPAPKSDEQIEAAAVKAAEAEAKRLSDRAKIKQKLAQAAENESRCIELRDEIAALDAKAAELQRLIDEHEASLGKLVDDEQVDRVLDAQSELAKELAKVRTLRSAKQVSYLAIAKDSCPSIYGGDLVRLARPDLRTASAIAHESCQIIEQRIGNLRDNQFRFRPDQYNARMEALDRERTRAGEESRAAAEAMFNE